MRFVVSSSIDGSGVRGFLNAAGIAARDNGVAYNEDAVAPPPASGSLGSNSGAMLIERLDAGVSDGHSCLSPLGVMMWRGRSPASIRLLLSLLGLGSDDSRAMGCGGSAFSCGSGLLIDDEVCFCIRDASVSLVSFLRRVPYLGTRAVRNDDLLHLEGTA